MSVYAAFLNEPDKSAWEALREKWPNGRSFVLTDNLAFVAPEGLTLTTEVADAVGIGEKNDLPGVVFEWGVHTGFNRGELWEWLSKVKRS